MRWITLVLCFSALILPAQAQQQAMTIGQSVQQALTQYPAIRSSLEQVAAAAAAIKFRTPDMGLGESVRFFDRSADRLSQNACGDLFQETQYWSDSAHDITQLWPWTDEVS